MSGFAISPPIEPMLAKLADDLPRDAGFLYEPKWDGFRAIVFRGPSDVFIQSRDLRPLDRYFPELHSAFLANLPKGSVVDGEIVIATPHGLDFDALQLRLHPADSRVAKLANATPAAFVAFDVLAIDGRDVRGARQSERRVLLGTYTGGVKVCVVTIFELQYSWPLKLRRIRNSGPRRDDEVRLIGGRTLRARPAATTAAARRRAPAPTRGWDTGAGTQRQ